VRRVAQLSLARAEKALVQDQSNGAAMGFGVGALAVLGEVERAKEWMARALLIDPDNMNMRYNFACAALDFKEPDLALELIEPFLATTSIDFLNHVKVDPDLEPLRADPRFKAMIAAADARLGQATGSTD
jgi:adenylate cyclase